jgi:hypothetical protein
MKLAGRRTFESLGSGCAMHASDMTELQPTDIRPRFDTEQKKTRKVHERKVFQIPAR